MTEWMSSAPQWWAETALNFIWQCAVLAAGAWIAARLLSGRQASARHLVWWSALALSVIIPVSNVLYRGQAELAPAADFHPAFGPVTGSGGGPAKWISSSGVPLGPPGVASPVSRPWPRLALPSWAAPAVPWLFYAWLGVAILLLARLGFAYFRVTRMKRHSMPPAADFAREIQEWRNNLPAGRTAGLRISPEAALPMLAGFGWPAVLVPPELFEELTAAERQAVWLHETAHARRWDDWTCLAQRLCEAVLFFHPAVWWMGQRIAVEREFACDEWVVSRMRSARPYAACLVKLAALPPAPRAAAALGMAAERKHIVRRVEMLIGSSASGGKTHRWHKILAIVGLAVAAYLMWHAGPMVLVAQPAQTETGKDARDANEARKVEAEVRRLAEDLIPEREKIQELSRQLSEEVRSTVEPHAREMARLSRELSQQVSEGAGPHVREMARLAAELTREATSEKPDSAKMQDLEKRLAEVKAALEALTSARVQELEARLQKLAGEIRPSEARIQELQERIKEVQEQIRARQAELEGLGERLRRHPNTPPPPPPAPPPPPPPPPPPDDI